MNIALILLVFLVAALVTAQRGLAVAFVAVFVPTLLFLSPVRAWSFPLFNGTTVPDAAIYGICAGLCLRPRASNPIRWNVVDTLLLLYAAAGVVTAVKTEIFYTGVSLAKAMMLGWFLPYLFARIAFHAPEARRLMLRLLLISLLVLGALALIEFRLRPRFYLSLLDAIGLMDWWDSGRGFFFRYGFFRTYGTVTHPIYFGNLCLVLAGMLGMLAARVPRAWRNWRVRVALACALACIVFSLSQTPWLGLGVALVIFGLLYGLKWTRRRLVMVVAVGIVAGFWFSYRLLTVDTTPSPSDSVFDGSYKIRALIMQNSWHMVTSAGLWGWGRLIGEEQLHLESVDNAYLLIGLRWGWVGLLTWLAIPVALAHKLSHAMRRTTAPWQDLSLIVGFAAIYGISAAMYTVWQDSSFTIPWLVLLGFTVSQAEIMLTQPEAARATRRMAVQPLPAGTRRRSKALGARQGQAVCMGGASHEIKSGVQARGRR